MRFTKRKLQSLCKIFVIFLFVSSLSYLWRSQNSGRFPGGFRSSFNISALTSTGSTHSFRELRNLIAYLNNRQTILNLNKFSPLRENDTIVLVQVHNRIHYLETLINSLQRAKGVENILLVFSHDIFDEQINTLVQKINFCKVIQIFYPYSLQLHPDTFPGPSKEDCPRDISKKDALDRKCINANSPDSYGHYREASYTQTKHHWFWKINYVFNFLLASREHNGFVVLLEEDHYVTPDVFYMLEKMKHLQANYCKQCDLITLGAYHEKVKYPRESSLIQIQKWLSSKHNMGMAINKAAWSRIRRCAQSFCTYDDYNWDWSLQHVSMKCLTSPLMTMNVVAPRVFHVGECGVHHKKKDCSQKVTKVRDIIRSSLSSFFPINLRITRGRHAFKMPKVNGGWGDIRDHMLCLHHLNM